ncbi:MAG: YdcF family protein, partial [Rhodospirillaceae bacterium]|nr:YdcF family protein [Rhodospirillaceae bacterium]
AALVAVAVLPVGDWITAPLEDRFPAPQPLPEGVDGIVVLGGGVETERFVERGQVGLGPAAERFTTAIALMRRYPQARVVYTAGDPSLRGLGANPPEAEGARRLYAALGVDTARILFEGRARTTHENAVLAKAAAHPQPGETWLLVTSAWHMPRAVGCFRSVGWPVVPYPVDYLTTGRLWRDKGLDLAGELMLMTVGSREWLGLAVYRLLGYTDALFPGPAPGPGA